jgi:hypothetical protein
LINNLDVVGDGLVIPPLVGDNGDEAPPLRPTYPDTWVLINGEEGLPTPSVLYNGCCWCPAAATSNWPPNCGLSEIPGWYSSLGVLICLRFARSEEDEKYEFPFVLLLLVVVVVVVGVVARVRARYGEAAVSRAETGLREWWEVPKMGREEG